MDEEKAIKTVTEALKNKVGRKIISEPFYKNQILDNATYICQSANPLVVDFSCGCFFYHGSEVHNNLESLLTTMPEFATANYLFLENINVTGTTTFSRFLVTPFAIIGNYEKEQCKLRFYKDVTQEIYEALNTLDISNFIHDYNNYFYGIENEKVYFSIVNKDDSLAFIDFLLNLNYDKDGEVHSSLFLHDFGEIKDINKGLKKRGLKNSLETNQGYIHNSNINSLIEELRNKIGNFSLESYFFSQTTERLKDFSKFVLSLPEEDQRNNTNILILKILNSRIPEDVDFLSELLLQGYQTKWFLDYFNIFNKDVKTKFIEHLQFVDHRIHKYDLHLWNQGFKNVRLDSLELYRTNPSGFIDYFENVLSLEEKKKIIHLLIVDDVEYFDESVNKFLYEKYKSLIDEVTFNG